VEAKREKTNEFLAKRNVVGMGVGYKNALGEESGQESVVVLVQSKKPKEALTEEDLIPKEINGIPTDVVEIGILRANQAANNNPRTRQRPVIFAGASIAHYLVGAGTLGIVVRHRTSGERLLLSNNHVLANSNDANIGDPILQPGPLDGGTRASDIVAQLSEFRRLAYIEEAGQAQPAPQPPTTTPEQPPTLPDEQPQQPTTPSQPTDSTDSGCDIVEAVVALANVLASASGSSKRVTSQSVAAQAASAPMAAQSTTGATPAEVPMIPSADLDNLLDAALARPINPAMFSDEIMQIGRINGTKEPTLGMTVAKFGRTTGYTTGRVTLLNATVNVQYDTQRGTRTARFVEQVITSGMSSSGDSGSLVIDPNDRRAVGLLFGGSGVASIFTPINRVLSVFNVGI
ncbi:MAG: hypothetical protein AAFV33_02840, partial [Chloroflexota bacterium]